MTFNKTTFALEIVVLFGFLIAIEWLAHALTDTQNMFVAAVLTLGSYSVVRMVISAWRTRHAKKTSTSH